MGAEDLKKAYEDAEGRAQKLMGEKDEALAKVRARYAEKLRAANDEAAAAQKAWLDAEAVEALLDRPDGADVAASLGLELPG